MSSWGRQTRARLAKTETEETDVVLISFSSLSHHSEEKKKLVAFFRFYSPPNWCCFNFQSSKKSCRESLIQHTHSRCGGETLGSDNTVDPI